MIIGKKFKSIPSNFAEFVYCGFRLELSHNMHLIYIISDLHYINNMY